MDNTSINYSNAVFGFMGSKICSTSSEAFIKAMISDFQGKGKDITLDLSSEMAAAVNAYLTKKGEATLKPINQISIWATKAGPMIDFVHQVEDIKIDPMYVVAKVSNHISFTHASNPTNANDLSIEMRFQGNTALNLVLVGATKKAIQLVKVKQLWTVEDFAGNVSAIIGCDADVLSQFLKDQIIDKREGGENALDWVGDTTFTVKFSQVA